MIPPNPPAGRDRRGIPRESGDDPGVDDIKLDGYTYSPRERG